jgi:hypothetical protein
MPLLANWLAVATVVIDREVEVLLRWEHSGDDHLPNTIHGVIPSSSGQRYAHENIFHR